MSVSPSAVDGDNSPSPAASSIVSSQHAADSASDLSDAASIKSSAPSEHSSDDEQSKTRQDTEDFDEEEYMRQNPELYGLRRSSRAVRASKPIIESDSDDEPVRSTKRKRPPVTASVKSSSRQSLSDEESGLESGSDSDFDRRKRARTKKRSSPGVPSTNALGEVRFSTRKAAKVVNYNETEDEDEEEEDAENLTPAYWAEQPAGPKIQSVLTHRTPDSSDEPLSRSNVEYYIQWDGQAAYHATWETPASLKEKQTVGLRKIDNYFNSYVLREISILNDPDVSEDDKEYFVMIRNQVAVDIQQSQRIERVIASRDEGDGREYLVKWYQTEYAACTWESDELVSELALQEIDKFLDRSRTAIVNNKTQRNPATRTRVSKMSEQPDYIGHDYGKLRDFQMTGLNFLAYNWAANRNSILADEMGLGKTVQAVSFMSWLHQAREQQGPFIVVVPLSTMPAWAETFDNWAPFLNYIVYHGNVESRRVIQQYELGLSGNIRMPIFNVLLTTWEMVNLDVDFLSQIRWELMLIDEAHKLKNRDAQIYGNLLKIKTAARVLLSGTPVQNNLKELTALLDLIEPGLTDIADDVDSLSHEEQAVQLADLREKIKPYMLRRTKERVEKDLPPKTERLIRMKLSETQLDLYSMLLAKNFKDLNEGLKGPKHSMANILMELRKASNHPFLIPAAQERYELNNPGEDRLKSLCVTSGKMMLLDQLLPKMKQDGHRVLIFSQMVKMLDIIEEYLVLRGHHFQRLDGTVGADLRRKAMDHFNAPESDDFCFLLTTRAGGLGINLMTADTVIIFDSDWNPQADLQAMARAHRIGQVNPVNVYRLVSEDTIDEDVIQRATKKRFVEYIIMNRGGEEDQQTSKAKKLAAAPEDSRDIIQMLKKRSQNMFEQTDNQSRLEKMDIDAVLAEAEVQKTEVQTLEADGGAEFLRSLEYVDVKLDTKEWSEIIPQTALSAAEAERVQAEEEERLALIVGETSKRKRNAPKAAVDDGISAEEPTKKPPRRVLHRVSPSMIAADPKRPLDLKECRSMYRALGKFGAFQDRTHDILKDAGLEGRDIEMLQKMMQDIVDEAERLTKIRDDDLVKAGTTNKKDIKTVLFDYANFKQLNAEIILDRPKQMRALRSALKKLPSKDSFRIPEANSVSGWAAPWGAREDAMLLIGTDRYGFGSWLQIRDDPELGMSDKMFLDENKAENKADKPKEGPVHDPKKKPAASHLKARSMYLLNLVRDRAADAGRPVSAHRNSHSLAIAQGKNTRPSSQHAVPKRRSHHDEGDDRVAKKLKPNGHTNGVNREKDIHRGTASPHPHPPRAERSESSPHKKRQDNHHRHDSPHVRPSNDRRDDSPHRTSQSLHDRSAAVIDRPNGSHDRHKDRGHDRHRNGDRARDREHDPERARLKEQERQKAKQQAREEQEELFARRMRRSKEDWSGFKMMLLSLREAKRALKYLKNRTRYQNQENPKAISDCLWDIGLAIRDATKGFDKPSQDAMKKRFWDFVADFYWLSDKTVGRDLRRTYEGKASLILDSDGDLASNARVGTEPQKDKTSFDKRASLAIEQGVVS